MKPTPDKKKERRCCNDLLCMEFCGQFLVLGNILIIYCFFGWFNPDHEK